MLRVVQDNVTVAYINRQDKRADGHRKEEPWLLLYVSGRIERFGSRSEARAEAAKTWPRARFSAT